MDLSLRAFLRGWEFVWVHDIECLSEIPSDYKASLEMLAKID